MTSRMASIDGTDPPGEWIHRAMSAVGILGGQGEQLRREQRAVVVVERSVEDEYPPVQQLLPDALAEQRVLFVVSHASSLRHGRPETPRALPWADLPTAA